MSSIVLTKKQITLIVGNNSYFDQTTTLSWNTAKNGNGTGLQVSLKLEIYRDSESPLMLSLQKDPSWLPMSSIGIIDKKVLIIIRHK